MVSWNDENVEVTLTEKKDIQESDGAQFNFWFEHFPGPTQGYVNQVTIAGITTKWAYYEVDLSTAVPIRDGLHDMTAVNRMSFGGPADLGAPYTILLDQIHFINNPGDGMLSAVAE